MGNASRKSDKVSAFDNLESRVLLSGTTVAYWRFEEGTAGKAASGAAGAILDSSGNGLNGTAVDGPVYESTVPTATIPQTGQADKLAMDFNGTDQRISIPNYSALAFTGSFTIEAYIDVEKTTSGEQQILFRGDNRTGHDPYFLAGGQYPVSDRKLRRDRGGCFDGVAGDEQMVLCGRGVEREHGVAEPLRERRFEGFDQDDNSAVCDAGFEQGSGAGDRECRIGKLQGIFPRADRRDPRVGCGAAAIAVSG
jgi:hypothetical protein